MKQINIMDYTTNSSITVDNITVILNKFLSVNFIKISALIFPTMIALMLLNYFFPHMPLFFFQIMLHSSSFVSCLFHVTPSNYLS